jgi:hypothetical protein
MWGNSTGWGISGAIVLLAFFVGLWMYQAAQVTAPTALSTTEANLQPLAIPIPSGVVDMTQSGDAGDLYRRAIDGFKETAAAEFVQNPNGAPPESIDLVLQGSNLSQCNLFVKKPAELVNYDRQHDAVDTLAVLETDVATAGMKLCATGNTAEGKKYLQAAFALGAKLANERVTYDEYSKGLGFMNGALEELANYASPDEKARLLAAESALVDYDKDHVSPIYTAISSIQQDVIAIHAGDTFKFAADSKDRMIRVEALLAMGRLHYDAARNADQIRCVHIASQYVNDPDPAVAAAAQAAKDLTPANYNRI